MANPNCTACKGIGGHYEDVVGDGGQRMWVDCEVCDEHELDSVQDALDKANDVDMGAEVVWTALRLMKSDNTLSIEYALTAALYEWVK